VDQGFQVQSEVDCVDDDVDGVFELVLEVDDESIPLALAFAFALPLGRTCLSSIARRRTHIVLPLTTMCLLIIIGGTPGTYCRNWESRPSKSAVTSNPIIIAPITGTDMQLPARSVSWPGVVLSGKLMSSILKPCL
jgi:hypothetical protein